MRSTSETSTSFSVGLHLASYRTPILSGLTLLVVLIGWAVFEWHQSDRAYRERMRTHAGHLAVLIEEARTHLGNGQALTPEALEPFLRSVRERVSHYQSVSLLQDGEPRIALGEALPPLDFTGPSGERDLDGRYLFWFTLGPEPASERRTSEAGSAPVLVVSIAKASAFENYERLEVLQTLGIGVAGILALVLAWVQSNRQRSLQDRLRHERTERERWQELSLAASGLAHETKNPLGIIRGLAQRIVDTAEGSDADRDRAQKIVDQADRAAARLGDFLSYARIREPELDVIDLGPMLSRAVNVLQPDFEAAGVPVELDIDDVRIRADREMLMQIFLNLVLNSLEASEPGQPLVIRCRVRGAWARLTFEDHGSGIEPAFLSRVFKPYVSGRPEGHGLGLAIVQRFVEQHGWAISVDSKPGRGTRFHIDGLSVVIAQEGRSSWHGF